MYTCTHSAKFSTHPTENTTTLFLALLIVITASLLGCDTYPAVPPSAGTLHEEQAPQGAEKDEENPRTRNNTVAFRGLTVTSLGKTTLSNTSDGNLRVAPAGRDPFGVSIDIAALDSTHIFFKPIQIPPQAVFKNTLYGHIDGIPKRLPGLQLKARADGTAMISAAFEDVFDRIAGDTVVVRFLYRGKVQYETTLPLQAQLPLASYHTGPSAQKAAAPSEEPTSTYWAHLEGCTWVLMYDWTEQPEKNNTAGPVTLVPAFETPFKEIAVDFIRVEFTYEAEHVSAERMELSATTSGFTLTNAEY